MNQYAFVGAGAVVTRDVPDFAMVYGVPAEIRGWMCRCGVQLGFEERDDVVMHTQCTACGQIYFKNGRIVTEKVEG